MYSIGKANRFSENDNTQFSSIPRYTPGPQYDVTDVSKYKFKTSSQWRIGTQKRIDPNDKRGRYDYYQHQDNYKAEEQNPKTWRTHIVGGAKTLEARIKYDLSEKTPGPGRYENLYKNIRPKSPAYFIAEKTGLSALKQLVGTPEVVGPGKYRVESAKFTSKHRLFPTYSIGKQKRPGLFNKNWAKNETYDIYSSMGNQHMSKKRTEARPKIGKSTRDGEKFRGTFSSMMDRQPMRINIPMPKI